MQTESREEHPESSLISRTSLTGIRKHSCVPSRVCACVKRVFSHVLEAISHVEKVNAIIRKVKTAVTELVLCGRHCARRLHYL